MRLEGWAITGWAAAGIAFVVVATLAGLGLTEEGVRSVVRSSAKIGVGLFALAFGASSLRRVWRSELSAWILRNRRHLGVSFAIAHFVHLGALVALGLGFPEPFLGELDALTLIGGGGAYALLAGMTFTSFDRTAALLSRKAWKRLHTVGGWVLWLIFLQSYLPRVFIEGAHYAPFALVLLAVFALRMWTRFSARAQSTPASIPTPRAAWAEMAQPVEFWFEFASTYSYLTAARIAAVGQAAGVDVVWRPFLLGPIFAELGWKDSPFNLQPAKGRYMWRDMERLCEGYGLEFRRPSVFPRNGLHAARIACAAHDEPWLRDFVQGVYVANFAHDRDIAQREVLTGILRGAEADPTAAWAAAEAPANKERLRAQTERARKLGIFGAPSFVVGDELFWGNDRLGAAMASGRLGS